MVLIIVRTSIAHLLFRTRQLKNAIWNFDLSNSQLSIAIIQIMCCFSYLLSITDTQTKSSVPSRVQGSGRCALVHYKAICMYCTNCSSPIQPLIKFTKKEFNLQKSTRFPYESHLPGLQCQLIEVKKKI